MTTKILIVDDEEPIRNMFSSWAEKQSQYKLEVSSDFKNVNPRNYDIIISDYNMQDFDAFATAKKIKLENPNVFFVLFSGGVVPKLSKYIDFFIQKPISPRKIFEILLGTKEK